MFWQELARLCLSRRVLFQQVEYFLQIHLEVFCLGIFGGKKEVADQDMDMLITTIETIDKPFEPLGLVTATIIKAHDPNPEVIAKELAKKAKEMGADAILGFRYDVRINAINWTDQVGYGTAVKFK